jgi:hypothetical protein
VRLPVVGVPDGELGRTGQGPRTELTHQVPGRRQPVAHAAPVPLGRLAGLRARLAAGATVGAGPGLGGAFGGALRRLAVVGSALVALAAGLMGAAWVGASWGGLHGHPPPAAETRRMPVDATPAEPAGTTTGAPSAGAAAAGPPGGEAVGPAAVPVPERTAAPADDAGWTALLSELYVRRAAAFTTADPAALDGVYLPGSALLDRDTGQLHALAEAGESLAGFTPQVRRLLAVTADGDGRFVLHLVDELPAYRVVPEPDGGASAVRDFPGRGEAEVRIVLQRTPAGWRISDAQVES